MKAKITGCRIGNSCSVQTLKKNLYRIPNASASAGFVNIIEPNVSDSDNTNLFHLLWLDLFPGLQQHLSNDCVCGENTTKNHCDK